MAFEGVNILVRKDAETPAVRWRQDAAIGSLITFSLSDTRDVRTFEWKIIGRPEGSGAGGGGPEPITLTTAQTCSITLDIPGAYIVSCTINGGSPNQTFKTAGVSILCTITDPVGRPLRYLGGYETDEDLADPLVAQGWIKMLDRWLHALEAYITSGGVDTFKVAMDAPDVAAAGYDFLPRKTHQGDYISLEVVTVSGVKKLQIGCTLTPDDHKFSIDAADNTAAGYDYAAKKLIAGTGGTVIETTGSHGKALAFGSDGKVIARNADTTTRGGLIEKTGPSDTITPEWYVDPVTGVERVRFNAAPAQTSGGAWLYTARVPDSKLRDPIRCLLQSNFRPLLLQPVKCLVADQGTWAEVYNPVALTLVHTTVGEIFGLDSSHGNTLALEVGDRVWFRGEYTQWSQTWSGLCIVQSKGSATEQAVLTAAPFDAFSVGKCFEVDGDGAYAPGLWTCVQVSPVLSFTSADPLPAAVDGCGFGTWWQQIAGTNLWQAPVFGPIYGQDQFADPSILLATGDRVLPYDSDHIEDEGQYYGPYEVLDPGFYYPPGAAPVLTRAIIRRALDADSSAELCNGMTVRVTPGAVAYSGNYFTISTEDPIEVDTTVLAWSISGSYTDGGVDRLLTQAQLGVASANTAEVATEIPALQVIEMLVPLRPPTLDGTPGAGEFPAGPVTYKIACRVSSDDPTAEVLISAALCPNGNVGGTWIGEATSQPIRATTTTVYTLQAQVAAPVPLSLSGKLYLWLWASNSGSSPVTLIIVYNDTAHSTRVQTTLNLASSGGTDDHRRLTATSRGFVAGEEVAAAANAHPVSALYPNRPQTLDRTVATVTGVLTIPTDCGTILRVSGTEALTTIGTDGWDLLSRVTLVFTQGRDVQHATGNIDTMQPPNADPTITVTAKDDMHLRLDLVVTEEHPAGVKTWIRSTAR
jgi:hypothetical protein